MTDTIKDVQQRFEEQLRYVDEAALVVLKGHLLIEEMLDSIISTFVFHGEFIEKANLSFWQKVAIARSMSLDEHQNEMWDIALKLNALRNDLAHALDSPARAKKTQAIVDSYFQLADDAPDFEKQKGVDDHIVLMFAVGFFLGFLSTFQDEVQRFRGVVDGLDSVLNPHHQDPLGEGA